MKIAVIGAGNWGKNLVRTFHSLGVLSSVMDPSEQIRSEVAKNYPDVTVFDSLEELLKSDITAVAIATPAQTHAAIALQAFRAGKDTFVEKPMSLAISEANELIHAANEHGRILMVGHLLLYQPAVRWIKNYLNEGKLGEIWNIHQTRCNLGRARKVENVLWSFGVHDIAVLLSLVASPVKNVKCLGQCSLQSNIEDDVYLHLQFENGVRAHLHNSWLWPKTDRHLTIVGSQGMLVYDEIAQKVLLHKKTISAELKNVDEGTEVVFEGSAEPLRLQLEHFLDCVKTRKEPLSHGASGLAVVEVLETASQLLQKDRENDPRINKIV